jgi:hypothetical protein
VDIFLFVGSNADAFIDAEESAFEEVGFEGEE